MNYIIINDSKFEVLTKPKMIYPPKHLWANWSEWDIKIKCPNNSKFEKGEYKTNMKLTDEYFDVEFEIKGFRKLSNLRDCEIIKLLVRNFNMEKSELSDKRDLIISELFD